VGGQQHSLMRGKVEQDHAGGQARDEVPDMVQRGLGDRRRRIGRQDGPIADDEEPRRDGPD